MPKYSFQKENGEVIELLFSMKEAPKIGEIVELDNGECVKRLASISFIKEAVPRDIYNIDKLSNFSTPHETVGDTMKRSEELSHVRAERNGGIDPIKKEFFNKYSEERGGKRHPKDTK